MSDHDVPSDLRPCGSPRCQADDGCRDRLTGVAGFLPKDIPADALVDAVRRVAAGERVIDQKLALAALEVAQSPLSAREAEVLCRVSAGADAAEIAGEMYLSTARYATTWHPR